MSSDGSKAVISQAHQHVQYQTNTVNVLLRGSHPGSADFIRSLRLCCDRDAEVREILSALREARERGDRRPVLCIIRGEQRDSHVDFTERLASRDIPGARKTPQALAPNAKLTNINWPLGGLQYVERLDDLKSQILQAVGLGSWPSPRAWSSAIDKTAPGGLVLSCAVDAHLWRTRDRALLSGLIECLLGIDVNPASLVVCLCLRHRPTPDGGLFLRLWRRWQWRRRTARMHAQVTSCRMACGSQLISIDVRLTAVPSAIVESWVHHQTGIDLGHWIDRVQRVFQQDDELPLHEIAVRLEKALDA